MKTPMIQFNVKNLKYALETAPKTFAAPVDLAYAVSITLEAEYNEKTIYGDGQVIAIIPDDKGKTGAIGVTNIENDYEVACGRSVVLVDGEYADVQQMNSVKHAIYYETDAFEDGVTKTVKYWVYGCTTGKSSESYAQTEDDPTINTYEYPLRVLGQNLEANLSTEDYIDSNGNTRKVYRIKSVPGDTNYATFGDTVPTPKSAA